MRPHQFSLLIGLIFLVCLAGSPASAVQWQRLAQTSRHEVSLDNDSLRITTHGRMAVWLRFTPLGEKERRLTAAEYGKPDYRLHLEYYEIDCSESTSLMGLTDFIGITGKVLERQKGNLKLDPIIPGTVLDRAAQQVCPAVEDGEEEDDTTTSSPETDSPESSPPTEELRKRITAAQEKTVKDPGNVDGWIELGNAYYDSEMSLPAIEAYNKALVINPDNADVLNDQGAMYRQSGEIAKAIANFEKALKAEPFNLETLYNIGYVYAFDLNNIDRALEIWQRYLDLDHTSETARQVQSLVDRYSKPKE